MYVIYLIFFFQGTSYVICLDSLSSSDNLYVHVSKPPKENSVGGLIYKELKTVSDNLGYGTIEGKHKKINLAEENLGWEHERFSIRRLPAATFSTLKSFNELLRNSIFDELQGEQINRLHRHTTVVAEALARHIYNISYNQIFAEPLVIFLFFSVFMRWIKKKKKNCFFIINFFHRAFPKIL